MKVAIVGAGISGLSCAHELEALGVDFDIFERRKKPGDISEYATIFLKVMFRDIPDFLQFTNGNFNIQLKSINKIKKIKMISENKISTVKGNLGSIFLRGQADSSIENQLYTSVKTPVNFDTNIDLNEIKNKYEKIVIATGNSTIAEQLGAWKDYFLPFGVKVTRIVGHFDPTQITVWLNTEYSKTGYVCLIPFNASSASIEIVAPNSSKEEIEKLWSTFTLYEKLTFNVVETYEIEFKTGIAEPLSIDNIYFIGNAGGFTEPFLGFGQLSSIWGGVIAARCIANNLDYNSEIHNVINRTKYMSRYRKKIDTMDNKSFDRLVKFLGLPGIRNLIYNTNINLVKAGSYLLRK